jgi:hypothetical protein
MSDSGSDYDVELYVKPDTIRKTYNNEDVISDLEAESDHSEAEQSDAEIKTPNCKLHNGTNGFTETDIMRQLNSLQS